MAYQTFETDPRLRSLRPSADLYGWFLQAEHAPGAVGSRWRCLHRHQQTRIRHGGAMWRLSCNHAIPTSVCTDSTMCAGQASGETGTAHPDESFCLIRALFRALELALPPGDFHLHHVRAHAGEFFYEIVDTAAKQEAHQSFNLPRQRLDLKVWRRKLLQLWTLIGQKCGLPPWHNGGFDIAVPDLPMQPASTIGPDTQQVSMHSSLSTTIFSCSFASANVQSLYRGPHGHTGKLHYLHEQMRQFQLNFMAVQEARSNEAMTKHNQILRISTGCCCCCKRTSTCSSPK